MCTCPDPETERLRWLISLVVQELLARSLARRESRCAARSSATTEQSMSQSGETYLALAQSVCALTDPECTAQPGGVTMPQPKSTVLQWNRRDQRFGDLLAVTDQSWQALTRQRVPDHHLTEHSFALRLSAGRAKGFRYLEAGTRHLLLALSLSKGALVFEFAFGVVDGLHGPVALASSSHTTGEAVYVVSAQQARVSVFQHAPSDHVSALHSTCPSGICAMPGYPYMLAYAWHVCSAIH